MNAAVAIGMSVALIAGFALAIQAPINSQLGRAVHSTLLAGTLSFSLSALLLIAISLLTGELRLFHSIAPVSRWLWIGGIFGPIYVLGVIYSVPLIGVFSAFAMVVAGQLVGALILDLVGAFGLTAKPISLPRVLSMVFVFIGVVLSRF